MEVNNGVNRFKCITFFLGVFFLVELGVGFAGVTSFNAGIPLKYAREVGDNNAVYRLPSSGTTVIRTMGLILGPGQNILVDVTLSGGALWDTSNTFNAAAELSVTSGYADTPTIVNSPGGTNIITYLVRPLILPTAYPTLTFTYNRYKIKDVANQIGIGKTIEISIQTRDAATGASIDLGTDSAILMIGDYGVQVDQGLVAGRATIDLGSGKTTFVSGLAIDNTPNITINGRKTPILNRESDQFLLTSADSIMFKISGNLAGISSISWGGASQSVGQGDISDQAVNLSVPGDNPNFIFAINTNFLITANGSSQLSARTLTAAITLHIGGNPAFSRNLIPAGTTLTTWDINATVLTANWVNGNNGVLNSRVYLWNPGDVANEISIQVYTLPNGPYGSTLLGTLDWGAIPAASGATIRVAEDVLAPLGVALPYTDDGGNLVLVMTAHSTGVFGFCQTFSNSFSFGGYQLRESPSR